MKKVRKLLKMKRVIFWMENGMSGNEINRKGTIKFSEWKMEWVPNTKWQTFKMSKFGKWNKRRIQLKFMQNQPSSEWKSG